KEEGRLDQPVDVAIDFTNIQYYGDKNDNMVVETQPKNGTTHAYQFATIKIVSGGEHYTLKALPVNKFSNKRDIVEELLDHAEKHIEIRRVYADRGFFSGKIINLFQERNQKFIMPAVRNQKVKQFLEEEEAPAIVRYTMKGKETSTFNLAIKKPENEDDPKPFATNCTQLEILGNNLFELYGRRWDIETGYRVQKNNFYPKTTSKNYNVRLFYFLFSQLLYNTWTLTNVKISLHLHDEIREEKEITAQEFVTKFFQAFLDYG
ncbi:MAG: transposase, partial [Candidatus Nanohaloarchaea archaeon]